ncbi:MAG: HAD-IC family P-type ATPase, partial [Candidatus Hydrogenedentes bacterium]|nr:HAD-IC family P-type ATPase [Candidatus Hydrogenedentota bacterium]
MRDWYKFEKPKALSALNVDLHAGLSSEEAASRLLEHGPNELDERGIKSPWAILWEQLTAIMVIILIVASIVSFVLGEWSDAIAILAIVFVNAILGLRQEYKAEKAMAALKKLAVPNVAVRRGGRIESVSARALVPGDIVLLDAGSHVPADCRIMESANLHTEEAALTGESLPVEKSADWECPGDAPVADRPNMVYMGTNVTFGRAVCLVTETAMRTELGKIASMIQSVDRSPTPLQVRLDHLGKVLAVVALALVALIFGLGLWREGTANLRELFLTSVSMAVAAVPEGLPAVVTIALALGAQRMLAKHALIRKLLAVEALGSVTVICSDKTGTLTENRMTVRTIIAGSRCVEAPVSLEAVHQSRELLLTLAAGAMCNDAYAPDESNANNAHGDPTETALAIVAARAGLLRTALEAGMPRVAEAPFDSQRKRMSTVHQVLDVRSSVCAAFNDVPLFVSFAKGAVDGMVSICNRVLIDGEAVPLDEAARSRILAQNDELAQEGLRVLGFAYAPLNARPTENAPNVLERDMIFAGLMALHDPPRAEAKESVRICKAAGIRPMMITGDHPLTARYVAADLGIASADARVVTGVELDAMSESERRRIVLEASVFARVTPET